MKYSIVIPVVPKHDRLLKNVVECLSAESDLVKEIIIARSELAPHKINQYKKFLKEISTPYNLESKMFLSYESKNCLAYANLNRGWMLAKGEFVTFLGADDLYAPYRLRVIDEIFRLKPKANAVLHSHFREELQVDLSISKSKFRPPFFWEEQKRKGGGGGGNSLPKLIEERLIDTNEIYSSTFPTGKRDYLSECFGNTSIKIPKNRFEIQAVTQGHISLRTDIREKLLYRPLQYGEDGSLCLDILENFGNVYFIALELSIYRKFLSVNRISSRLSTLKHKLLKLTPRFILKLVYN